MHRLAVLLCALIALFSCGASAFAPAKGVARQTTSSRVSMAAIPKKYGVPVFTPDGAVNPKFLQKERELEAKKVRAGVEAAVQSRATSLSHCVCVCVVLAEEADGLLLQQQEDEDGGEEDVRARPCQQLWACDEVTASAPLRAGSSLTTSSRGTWATSTRRVTSQVRPGHLTCSLGTLRTNLHQTLPSQARAASRRRGEHACHAYSI